MNHPEIVTTLLDRHADLQMKTKQHRYTALHLAAYKGHLDIIKLFLKNNKVIRILEAKDKSGNSAFLLAAMQGHWQVMEAILNFYSKRGDDLVPTSSTTKDPTTYLLQHDRDIMGNAALMLAVNKGHYQAAKFVLDYPSGIEMIDDANGTGETPLMRASKKGFVGIIRLLLMKGADIDAVDNKGENAFFYGIKAQMTASTDLLKEYYDLDGRGQEITKMMEMIKKEYGADENYEL
jgi:ankyrin repeat protein